MIDYFKRPNEQRLVKYQKYEDIYRSRHERVFDLDGKGDFPNVIINVANAIIDGLSGLVTTTLPTFTLKTQAAQNRLDEVFLNSSFLTSELSQFVTEGMLYGDSLLKVFMGADGIPQVRCISPKRWSAVADRDDADSIVEHQLISIKEGSNGTCLALVERHVRNSDGLYEIRNEVRLVSEGELGAEASLSQIQAIAPEWINKSIVIQTKIDEPLIIPWSHDKLCGDVYGTSELECILPLIRTLDQRATQEDRVLTKHADPKLILQEGTFERQPDGSVVITDLDVVITPQGSSKDQIGYITWEAQLGAVDIQIKRMIEQQLQITQTSRLLLSADQTQAQTGEAFKIQLFPSILKATLIQRSLEKPLRTLARVVQKFASANGKKLTLSPVEISWGVELPMNKQSEVQAEVQAVEAGIKTVDEARNALDQPNNI